MKRMITWTGLTLGAVLALSACTVTVETPISERVDGTISPETQSRNETFVDASPARTVTLAPGDRRIYEVVNGSLDAGEGLYVALGEDDAWDPEVLLRAYRSSGATFASSATSEYFASGTRALQVPQGAPPEVNSQIVTQMVCPGSCIIAPRMQNARYVSIRNDGNATRTIDVYAVVRPYADDNEPNESTESAVLLDQSGGEGALETLDDTDVFEVTQEGTYELLGTADSALTFRADVYHDGEVDAEPDTVLYDGDQAYLYPSDLVFVRTDNGRAAAANNSQYFIESP